MKKICMFLVLCLVVMLPCCKKKLPTQADIPTKVLPTIEYFHATPESINRGELSILSWSTKNATNITIDQGVGTVSAKDTIEVSPEETTTYTLTATNSDGQKTQSCTVEVVILNLPIIEYFRATQTSIMVGEMSTLFWSTTNAETLVMEPFGDLTIPWEGTLDVRPTETTTYTLIATNSDGQTTSSCIVQVIALAIFELTEDSRDYAIVDEFPRCRILGTVKNYGYATGYNVMVEYQAHGASNVIGTATADLGNIPAGGSASFEAIFFEINDWDLIVGTSYEITWLTAQGMRLTQTGIVPFK